MSNIRKIASHYLFAHGELIPRGIVCLDSSGTVVGVERARRLDSMAGVEFYDGMIIPGMVNAHCHMELSHMGALMAPGLGQMGFVQGMSALRHGTLEARQRATDYQDAAMWQQGVQAVGDVSNGSSTFELKSRSNIYYHTFLEMYGFDDNSFEGLVGLQNEISGFGLSSSITPHSPYSLSMDSFRRAVDGECNSPLSVHFMESIEGCGAMRAWHDERGVDIDFLEFASPAARVIAQIAGDRSLLLVHNTYLDERAAIDLAQHFGRNLTWVLCPCSDDYITGGRPPIELLRDTGCNIAVGTDSMASNRELSMVAQMKALQELGASLKEVIGWSSAGGAKALGVDVEFGSIEDGKRPGIVILSGVDWESMTLGESAATGRIV